MKTVDIHGVKLVKDGDRIVSSVESGKPFEPETIKTWRQLCKAGDTVLDVGAYTGLFSIVAAKNGCNVIAFEPLVENRQRFSLNIMLNHVDCMLKGEAVSDQVGRIAIKRNPRVNGLTSGASIVGKEGSPQWVKTLTIDSLNLPRCAAIKIDVERAEPLVLEGAKETLRRLRPVLIVEVLGDDEKERVRASLPDCYDVTKEMDGRNWLLEA